MTTELQRRYCGIFAAQKRIFARQGGADGNFPYLSHATYVLGIIGGVSRRAIKENAVADMYRNAMLTGSQAVANITETAKVRSYILWTRVEYIATGTIVEFTE